MKTRSPADKSMKLCSYGKRLSWRYEREWRVIGDQGLQDSPLEMEEIIFGLRCKASAKYAVMKAFKERERAVKFFEIREVAGTFQLRKYVLHHDDLVFVGLPRRALSVFDDFEGLSSAGWS